MAKAEKKGRKPAKRDEHGRFVSPVNGQPVPEGRPFRTGDERAKQAGIASGIARKEKGDLRKLCQLWMEEEVATGKDGEKITGGQMMVRVAVKEYFPGGIVVRSLRTNGVTVVSDQAKAEGFRKGIEEFQNEAKRLAAIDSPNIVKVRDYFRENGTG